MRIRNILLFFGGLLMLTWMASCSRDVIATDADDEYTTWQHDMREADADSYEWELNYSE